MITEMTAIEMARKYGWAEVTVFLDYGSGYAGHFTVGGRTRIIENSNADAVWVGNLALKFDTVVSVETVAEGAVVSVHSLHQSKMVA
jgi:hypothetical protein